MTPTATQTFDDVDHALLDEVQQRVPIDHRPFELLGQKLGIGEQECLRRIERLKDLAAIRHIGAHFDARTLGYQRVAAAMRMDPGRVGEAAEIISQYPGVSYICKRNDPFNLWWVGAVGPDDSLDQVVKVLHALAHADETILLPAVRYYTGRKPLEISGQAELWEDAPEVYEKTSHTTPRLPLNEQDVRFIRILQEDLPLIEMPFTVLAEQAGTSEDELFAWLRKTEHVGVLRRFAADVQSVKSHALHSALVVWQVPSEAVDAVGEQIAQFRELSRCYRCPVSESWPYPLFTMITAPTSSACMDVVKRIEEQVGRFPHKHLFTMQEYTRVRTKYFHPELEGWWKRVDVHAASGRNE